MTTAEFLIVLMGPIGGLVIAGVVYAITSRQDRKHRHSK